MQNARSTRDCVQHLSHYERGVFVSLGLTASHLGGEMTLPTFYDDEWVLATCILRLGNGHFMNSKLTESLRVFKVPSTEN